MDSVLHTSRVSYRRIVMYQFPFNERRMSELASSWVELLRKHFDFIFSDISDNRERACQLVRIPLAGLPGLLTLIKTHIPEFSSDRSIEY